MGEKIIDKYLECCDARGMRASLLLPPPKTAQRRFEVQILCVDNGVGGDNNY